MILCTCEHTETEHANYFGLCEQCCCERFKVADRDQLELELKGLGLGPPTVRAKLHDGRTVSVPLFTSRPATTVYTDLL